MGQWVHQPHIAIYANQNKEVNAAECIHFYYGRYHFAQALTESPIKALSYIVSPEGQTAHQNKVSSSQVAQVDLSYCAGFLVEAENHQHKRIKDDSKHTDGQDVVWTQSEDQTIWLKISTICIVLVSRHRYRDEVDRDTAENREQSTDKTLL